MKVIGIDFTSRPTRRKSITALYATFANGLLRTDHIEEWHRLADFECALRSRGNWIAGLDFPFGQARRFIENIGWPKTWTAYVAHAGSLGRSGFRAALDAYRHSRPIDDREHRRRADVRAGSISPQKLYGVPVGLMFFEGAPRLITTGVMIPHLHAGDPSRIAVETYPALLARRLIGRRSYKHDHVYKRSMDHASARREILRAILAGAAVHSYGVEVVCDLDLTSDPTGDRLDALLCAIQAAWAWSKRDRGFGAPSDLDPLEGWIADPLLDPNTSKK